LLVVRAIFGRLLAPLPVDPATGQVAIH
jgi:hypothetical protein